MKTVLVLSSNPAFPGAITAGLSTSAFKIIHRIEAREAEPLIRANIVDLCIVDFESDQIDSSWKIVQLRRLSSTIQPM